MTIRARQEQPSRHLLGVSTSKPALHQIEVIARTQGAAGLVSPSFQNIRPRRDSRCPPHLQRGLPSNLELKGFEQLQSGYLYFDLLGGLQGSELGPRRAGGETRGDVPDPKSFFG